MAESDDEGAMFIVDENRVEYVVKETLCWPPNRRWDTKEKETRIRSFFGAPCSTIAMVWNRIWDRLTPGEKDIVCKKGTRQVQYLLYALVFLKVYSSEEVHCSIVGWPSAKTFRKWSWFFIRKISELKEDVIQLERRFDNLPEEVFVNCFVSVDGTDCPIFEPWPFNPKNFSHKTNGPALKYEVAVGISTGFIVWVNGPFQGGKGDSAIFKEGLKNLLFDEELVEVDAGYRGDDKFMNPNMASGSDGRKEKSIVRGRHENVNGRLKIYNVLTTYFRHMKPRHSVLEKHKICFESVAVLTQLKMEFAGESLYDVEYNENYYY